MVGLMPAEVLIEHLVSQDLISYRATDYRKLDQCPQGALTFTYRPIMHLVSITTFLTVLGRSGAAVQDTEIKRPKSM